MLTLTGIVFTTVFVALLALTALWLIYDNIGVHSYEKERLSVLYKCVRCGTFYVKQNNDEDRSCPSCKFKNIPLKF